MDEEEEEVIPLEGVRWSWFTPLILVLSMVGSIIAAIADLFIDHTAAVARHSIWAREQRDFRENASRDIERITQE